MKSKEDKERDKEAMKYAQPYKVKNILDGLPKCLRDPKCFQPIQKALINTLSCGKLHSDPVKMSECSKCTDNMILRKELMKKFGFKNVKQYMAWRKIHEDIKRRMPLDMYNRMVNG